MFHHCCKKRTHKALKFTLFLYSIAREFCLFFCSQSMALYVKFFFVLFISYQEGFAGMKIVDVIFLFVVLLLAFWPHEESDIYLDMKNYWIVVHSGDHKYIFLVVNCICYLATHKRWNVLDLFIAGIVECKLR